VYLVSCPSRGVRLPCAKSKYLRQGRTHPIITRIAGNLDKLRDILLHYALAHLRASNPPRLWHSKWPKSLAVMVGSPAKSSALSRSRAAQSNASPFAHSGADGWMDGQRVRVRKRSARSGRRWSGGRRSDGQARTGADGQGQTRRAEERNTGTPGHWAKGGHTRATCACCLLRRPCLVRQLRASAAMGCLPVCRTVAWRRR
jgi:hypothetical protein